MQAAAKAEKAERIAQGLEPAEEEGPRYVIAFVTPFQTCLEALL